ncbi:hypothetical protein PCE1_001204 [Barthelona sp. PCE]
MTVTKKPFNLHKASVIVKLGMLSLVLIIFAIFATTANPAPTNDAVETASKIPKIILSILGIIYCFIAISIVCDGYFVAAAETCVEVLKIPPSVGGATITAIGSSAPELFTSIAALIQGSDSGDSDLGLATIVGSAMVNLLVIIGLSSIFAGKVLNLDYRPLLRDSFFYVLSIIILGVALHDGRIVLWEAVGFVLIYVSYVVFMTQNDKILNRLPEPKHLSDENFQKNLSAVDDGKTTSLLDDYQEDASLTEEGEGNKRKSMDFADVVRSNYHKQKLKVAETPRERVKHALMAAYFLSGHTFKEADNDITDEHVDGESQDEEIAPWFKPPPGGLAKIHWFICLPISCAFAFTIPDCRKKHLEKWWMVTFTMSIAWVGFISYCMVELTYGFGALLQIDPVYLGIPLAIGTSIPDTLSSVLIARSGRDGAANMAVSNGMGSNVFNILVGCGAPWLVTIIVSGKYVDVDSNELIFAVIVLMTVMILILFIFLLNGFRLTPKIGTLFVIMYILYLCYQLGNMFGFW